MGSSERRVTISGTIYPKLQELADRDGVSVADIANAIILQVIQPYGPCNGMISVPNQTIPASAHDHYKAAAIDSW